MVAKVLPSPILPQVSPRTLDGMIATSQVTTRQLLDIIRDHARAINQLADYVTGLDGGWTSYTPTVTAAAGTITTLGAVSERYKFLGANTVLVDIDITITTNGTGAGYVNVTLPFTPSGSAVGVGRETAVTGHSLVLTTGGAAVAIVKYDGTYPGGNGHRLLGSIIYLLA